MRNIILASIVSMGLVAPSTAALPAGPDASTRKDVQCFLLFATAVGNAKDEAAAKPASIGLAYYLGKITRGAPAINMVEVVKQEAKVLEAGDPRNIGAACEQEFSSRMADVDKLGQALSAGH